MLCNYNLAHSVSKPVNGKEPSAYNTNAKKPLQTDLKTLHTPYYKRMITPFHDIYYLMYTRKAIFNDRPVNDNLPCLQHSVQVLHVLHYCSLVLIYLHICLL